MLVIQAQGKRSCGKLRITPSASKMWIPPGQTRVWSWGPLLDNWSPAMSRKTSELPPRHTFDSAEMGVIAHLYRGEVYRSTIWRTRLDHTTNWSMS